MEIQDIGIVDDAIFVTDGRKLVNWRFGAGGIMHGARGARKTIVGETLAISADLNTAEHFALSNDCSQIGFAINMSVFLYDVAAQKIIGAHTTDGAIADIWFSPDGRRLWVAVYTLSRDGGDNPCYSLTLEMAEDLGDEWSSSTIRPLSRTRNSQSHEYRIGSGSGWVENSGGSKLLWLPPSWRTKNGVDARWHGNFLAFVGGHHQKPIVIGFQPPHPCTTRSSDT
jgi:hypothetical protein